MEFLSKKELDEATPKYPLLQPDDYELVITGVEETTQSKYKKPDEMEDIVNITMEIVSYRDGGEPADEEDGNAVGRKMFLTARPNSSGFTKEGIPSKTRSIVAYTMGFNVEDKFEIESWEQLLGKKVFAEITIGTNQKGTRVNKLIRLISPKKDRKIPKIKDKEIPVIEDKK